MTGNDTYITITKESEGYFRDRGSKFYAFAYPVENEEQIKDRLEYLRKKYFDARHHGYAWVLGPEKTNYRINDDGEPGNSAGRPIYGRILSHDLTNILIVVIRYFGGVKLGIPGLINAYKTAAEEAITQNTPITKTINTVFELTYAYPLMNEVMRVVKEDNLNVILQDFGIDCRLQISVRRSVADSIESKLLSIRNLTITNLFTA
ncbi:MAG: YigZ family protein [Bacteroidales bacterium]|nr:YigZ family protein [Bacteroidales bacterium]